jgi:hypothetical protein
MSNPTHPTGSVDPQIEQAKAYLDRLVAGGEAGRLLVSVWHIDATGVLRMWAASREFPDQAFAPALKALADKIVASQRNKLKVAGGILLPPGVHL